MEENKLPVVSTQVLPGLSSSDTVADFNSRTKIAIKIDQGINGKSLVAFKKEAGGRIAVATIATYVKRQSEFFNLVDNITEIQAADIAELMFTEYPGLTIEDVAICLRYAKVGKPGYEKPMSRLDGRIVFNWLNQYLDEKYEKIEQLRAIESHDYKSEPMSAETLQRIGDLFDKVGTKAKEPEPPKPIYPLSAEKQEQYIRENAGAFSKEQLTALLKQFQSHHACMGYEKIIGFLQEELTKRK